MSFVIGKRSRSNPKDGKRGGKRGHRAVIARQSLRNPKKSEKNVKAYSC
jgi:hypothetical protein